VTIAQRRDPMVVADDEHPRGDTTLAALGGAPTPFRDPGTVTAGNASGINDGACALLLASEAAAAKQGLEPRARVLGMAVTGLEPSIMGYGPVEAVRRLLGRCGLSIDAMDVIELNEAFAAQALAVTRALGIADDAEHLNPNGGAIALGHPLGMSGARLVLTATEELQRRGGRYALCSMCIGVGQGAALLSNASEWSAPPPPGTRTAAGQRRDAQSSRISRISSSRPVSSQRIREMGIRPTASISS
jgi:acetyl-CoA acyltransferase